MRRTLLILLSLLVYNMANASFSLSLSEAIHLAQEHSLDAKAARFTFLGGYWTYHFYRTELLPSASLGGSLLNYDHSVTSVRNYFFQPSGQSCPDQRAEERDYRLYFQ